MQCPVEAVGVTVLARCVFWLFNAVLIALF